MVNNMKENTGFKELLNKMMSRRWYITALVLGSFIIIIGGIFAAICSPYGMPLSEPGF